MGLTRAERENGGRARSLSRASTNAVSTGASSALKPPADSFPEAKSLWPLTMVPTDVERLPPPKAWLTWLLQLDAMSRWRSWSGVRVVLVGAAEVADDCDG